MSLIKKLAYVPTNKYSDGNTRKHSLCKYGLHVHCLNNASELSYNIKEVLWAFINIGYESAYQYEIKLAYTLTNKHTETQYLRHVNAYFVYLLSYNYL